MLVRQPQLPWHHARPETLTLPAPAAMSDHPPPERAMSWEAEALWRRIEPRLPGLSIEVLARTDSTNTQLVQRLRGGLRGDGRPETRPDPRGGTALPGRRASDLQPCLLVAEHQTAGRGRLGRDWQAAPGASLTFSLAVPLSPTDWSGLSLVVGLAVAQALDPAGESASLPRIGLKWPNDLWFDERKLGGILIESIAVGQQRLAIIGIGLNIKPMSVGPLSQGYACLDEMEPGASAPATLHRVAPTLVDAIATFEREGFAPWVGAYARRDVLRGRAVRSGSIEGIADGVAPNGGLRVRTDAGEQLITSNEVSVRVSPWGPTTQAGTL